MSYFNRQSSPYLIPDNLTRFLHPIVSFNVLRCPYRNNHITPLALRGLPACTFLLPKVMEVKLTELRKNHTCEANCVRSQNLTLNWRNLFSWRCCREVSLANSSLKFKLYRSAFLLFSPHLIPQPSPFLNLLISLYYNYGSSVHDAQVPIFLLVAGLH